eukprot:63229-Rhodomonas_salina.4
MLPGHRFNGAIDVLGLQYGVCYDLRLEVWDENGPVLTLTYPMSPEKGIDLAPHTVIFSTPPLEG